MSEATTLQSIKGGFTRMASGMAVLVMAFALGGCFHTVPTCPAGQVPVVSTAAYAVYTTAANQNQVENVTQVKNRCFVTVTEKPAGSGSTSQPTSCPAGTSKLAIGTVWGTYYDGLDVGKQAEDTGAVNDRCIVEVPLLIPVPNPCPPGTHAKVIAGRTYCVPN
jgi:hypothetical protein